MYNSDFMKRLRELTNLEVDSPEYFELGELLKKLVAEKMKRAIELHKLTEVIF